MSIEITQREVFAKNKKAAAAFKRSLMRGGTPMREPDLSAYLEKLKQKNGGAK